MKYSLEYDKYGQLVAPRALYGTIVYRVDGASVYATRAAALADGYAAPLAYVVDRYIGRLVRAPGYDHE